MRMASSSSAFMVICILHSLIAVTCGALMMFYMKEVYTFGHGVQTATKLLGSTPHDQLLIKTSDSFSGLLLVAIGFLLFMVSFVRDRDFQVFFAKGCTLLHLFMAMWRIYFERKVEDLAWDWLRQTVGDLLLALSWVFFLVYSWRENAAMAVIQLTILVCCGFYTKLLCYSSPFSGQGDALHSIANCVKNPSYMHYKKYKTSY